jgi:hypothetical protein
MNQLVFIGEHNYSQKPFLEGNAYKYHRSSLSLRNPMWFSLEGWVVTCPPAAFFSGTVVVRPACLPARLLCSSAARI